jgi:phosphoribosylformylglycinamidine synthase subunit PurQ / glutaminase
MRFGVVTFPGSNCDYDCYKAVQDGLGAEAVFLWHKEHDLQGVDAVFLPGGFSYGDYLRAGAIAAHSPIMREVVAFAREGGPVAGICNGFQILCESGLLPGALVRNRSLRFRSRPVHLLVERNGTAFTSEYEVGQVLEIPIAHGEGCYFAAPELLDELEAGGQVVFRYCDAEGLVSPAANPNGSARNIAGIINASGNVLGMMPHPERAVDPLLGATDGLGVFRSLAAHLARV